MDYLFLVSIGPVQDFIASARRTRDLAFGSWFLSELSRAAARAIVDQNGLESLIFPAPASIDMLDPYRRDFLVANKLIALIQQDPQTLGKDVREAVMTRLRRIRERAFETIAFPDGKRPDAADKQIENLLECSWTALPFRQGQYQQTRTLLETLMAARKNTRTFSQVTWGDAVPKSSIGGQLESIIPETEYPDRRDSPERKAQKIRDLYEHYGAGPAERLSAVDLLKRRGVTAYGEHFPSTSHIATLPFLQRLRHLKPPYLSRVQQAWADYIGEVQQRAFSPQLERTPLVHPVLQNYDGSLLLESRLVDVLYVPGEDTSKSLRLQEVKQALQTFYQVLDTQCRAQGIGTARPDPYYAFLQADGDGMGEIINAQAAQGPTRHRALSYQLAGFATQARVIVEKKHRGVLVYSGGDDVMALLPLDTVLACACELARAFKTIMQDFEDHRGRKPTLSAGVAIAHHLEALHRVRQLAYTAEQRAKKWGKNALGMTLSKRSGEDYQMVGHWEDLEQSMPRLITFCRDASIPTGTAYELRDLALRLGIPLDEEADEARSQAGQQFADVLQWDALRILKRKLYVPPGKFPQRQAEEIERTFKARLGLEQDPHPDVAHIQSVSIGDFIHELLIAQLLAKAQRIAEPEKERSRV